jgi:CheY-like chemotaxis protein
MAASSDPSDIPPELLADYRRAVAVQVAALQACADRLVKYPTDLDALETFRREVHKVRGSAGSYGFPEASDLAAGMEATAKDWIDHAGEAQMDRGALARWFIERLTDFVEPDHGSPAPAETPSHPLLDGSAVPEVISVEDDHSLAELLVYGLQSRGYRYAAYQNGAEALEALLALNTQGRRPLVLLDVDLPGIDGFSLFERLELERPGAYRVVFTSVHSTEDEQVRALEAGALDYLIKPISLRVVLEKIRRWVGR